MPVSGSNTNRAMLVPISPIVYSLSSQCPRGRRWCRRRQPYLGSTQHFVFDLGTEGDAGQLLYFQHTQTYMPTQCVRSWWSDYLCGTQHDLHELPSGLAHNRTLAHDCTAICEYCWTVRGGAQLRRARGAGSLDDSVIWADLRGVKAGNRHH